MTSQGTTEERNARQNAQITTNLYLSIQIWAFIVIPNRFIAMIGQGSIRSQGKFV